MAAAQCALRWAAGADLMVLAGSVRGAGKWAARLVLHVCSRCACGTGMPCCDGM